MQTTFGALLRNARIEQGLDLNVVSRRLRIRPDILKAIEAGNFSQMPPHGYSRNMINAYARFLGLNSTDVTSKYLDEYYEYQTNKNYDPAASQKIFDIPEEGYIRRVTAQKKEPRKNTLKPEKTESTPGRTLYTANQEELRSKKTPREHNPSVARPRRETQTESSATQYTNFYSGPKASRFGGSRLPFIIAGAVIVILLIIILVLVFGPKNDATNEANHVPVTGVSDVGVPSDSIVEEESEKTQTKRAPVDFTFSFSVSDGGNTWIEVYVNDAVQIAEVVQGPRTETYRSSGTIRFITANATVVTAKIDGEEVPLEVGMGEVFDKTYTFDEILTAWKNENGVTDTATDTTTGSSGNTSTTNNASGTASTS